MDAVIEKDTEYELTAAMQQQVRQLTLVIEPTGGTTDRIEGVEGYFSGAAATLDMDNGTYGTPSNVALTFTKPLALGGTVAETPTGAGFSATITDWKQVTGGPVTAD